MLRRNTAAYVLITAYVVVSLHDCSGTILSLVVFICRCHLVN